MTNLMQTAMAVTLTISHINDLIEAQLLQWPEAAANFNNLRNVERRNFVLGDFRCAVQLNPARIRSTTAAVDARSVEERPCFLCESNRPECQISVPWVAGWQLLVNPFPILPVHFTIVNPSHSPQGDIPLEMAAMAENAPDLVIFYNGARAGASAPDHQHAQAVLKSELPIIALTEKCHPSTRPGWMSSEDFELDLPFHFMSAVISPDELGMRALSKCSHAFGIDGRTGAPDSRLLNSFMWIDDSGLLRILIIPRKAHRPSCFFTTDSQKRLVSPGAIDMAGIVITPREIDFKALSDEEIRAIYGEVAFADGLPEIIKSHFKVER